MANAFDTRNISFYTPKSQWDPILRYYNAVLLNQRRSIDLMPQVRVEPIPGTRNQFVVQWSLGGYGDPIPGTPLREYSPPNVQQLNEWLVSMEETNIEAERPYLVESDGLGLNFPREIHNFALEALTAEGDLLYLGTIEAENINDPTIADGLTMPYWGVTSNRIPFYRGSLIRITENVERGQAEWQRCEDNRNCVHATALEGPSPTEYQNFGDVWVQEAQQRLDNAITENNNRPFWRVLREGSGGIITPDTVATVYNQLNPPPDPEPQDYVSPKTLGQAVSTIYQMLENIRNTPEERQRNRELLVQAVQEQIGINLEQRFNTIASAEIPYPISSMYFGSQIQTPFVVDGKSAEYLRLGNMTELAGSEYGLVKPTYNRYLPTLEASEAYEGIKENNLVNFYALMGSINTDTLENRTVPAGWIGTPQRGNFVYSKYKDVATLSGSVPEGLLDLAHSSIFNFYKSYMDKITQSEPSKLSQLGNLFKRAKFPDASTPFLSAYKFNQVLMPYYITANFKSGETGEVLESINTNRLSSYVLDKVQKNEEDMETEVYTLTSDVISQANHPTMSTLSKNTPLRQKDFHQVVRSGLLVGISDLNFNTKGEEGISGDVITGARSREFDRLQQTVRRESRKEMLSYVDRVENKQFSNTEALADVIVKRVKDSSNVTSKNYIATPNSPEVFEYTDTQVKYGVEYNYQVNRFQMLYGTSYSYKTLDITTPLCLRQSSAERPNNSGTPHPIYINYETAGAAIPLVQQENLGDLAPGQTVGYSFVVEVSPASPQLLEVPVYNPIYGTFGENISGVSFEPISVRDYPPTPPVLEVQPLRDNFRQVLININLESIGRTTATVVDGPQCLEGTSYQDTYNYQKLFIDFLLPEDKLIFQNDGLSEITNVTVVRTDKIVPSAYEVEDPYEAYKSFCPETNPEAEIMRKSMSEDFGQVGAGSYGFLDDILPNKYYYYTSYCKDLRENVSNPSDIYQVRLVYDKGFLVPEIGLLNIESMPNKVPVKKMTRFLEIRPSSIQTQPFMERDENDDLISYSSLIEKAATAGILTDEQTGNVTRPGGFIIRVTSKDTGRKIDIRLTVTEEGLILNNGNNPDMGDL